MSLNLILKPNTDAGLTEFAVFRVIQRSIFEWNTYIFFLFNGSHSLQQYLYTYSLNSKTNFNLFRLFKSNYPRLGVDVYSTRRQVAVFTNNLNSPRLFASWTTQDTSIILGTSDYKTFVVWFLPLSYGPTYSPLLFGLKFDPRVTLVLKS